MLKNVDGISNQSLPLRIQIRSKAIYANVLNRVFPVTPTEAYSSVVQPTRGISWTGY
jgi:hypothetical protein